MQVETMMAVKNCGQCRLFEGQDQQPELYTIEASEPLDLVHIDLVSMETMLATKKKTSGTKGFGSNRPLYMIHPGLSSR